MIEYLDVIIDLLSRPVAVWVFYIFCAYIGYLHAKYKRLSNRIEVIIDKFEEKFYECFGKDYLKDYLVDNVDSFVDYINEPGKGDITNREIDKG